MGRFGVLAIAMGQKKNLFAPEQIVERRPLRRQDASPLPSSQSPSQPPRHATWPFLLFVIFLALMTVLTWIGQMGR